MQAINIPGNFLGLRRGTNFAPIAKAIDGPNMNPRASTPTKYSQPSPYEDIPSVFNILASWFT